MDPHKFDKLSKPLLRIGLSLVFLYFGFQQITSPNEWVSFVPDWALKFSFGLSANNIVMANAILELTLGIFLIIGLYTKFSALILSLHLFGIAFSMGINQIAVRDFGLAVATLVVFLNGMDSWCLDKKFGKKDS